VRIEVVPERAILSPVAGTQTALVRWTVRGGEVERESLDLHAVKRRKIQGPRSVVTLKTKSRPVLIEQADPY